MKPLNSAVFIKQIIKHDKKFIIILFGCVFFFWGGAIYRQVNHRPVIRLSLREKNKIFKLTDTCYRLTTRYRLHVRSEAKGR